MIENYKDQLRLQAAQKRFPEFYEECQEIAQFYNIAQSLHRDGRLSSRELADFESTLWARYERALPMEMYAEFARNGVREELEALKSFDKNDTRHPDDIERDRKDVVTKIKRDLMDDAWLDQKVDSKKYAELYASEIDHRDEGLNDLIRDGKYDDAASEIYARRHDEKAPDVSRAMEKWAKDNDIKDLIEASREAKRLNSRRAKSFDDGYDERGRDKDGVTNWDVLQEREERAMLKRYEEAEVASPVNSGPDATEGSVSEGADANGS
jgi:hypothetical protein